MYSRISGKLAYDFLTYSAHRQRNKRTNKQTDRQSTVKQYLRHQSCGDAVKHVVYLHTSLPHGRRI